MADVHARPKDIRPGKTYTAIVGGHRFYVERCLSVGDEVRVEYIVQSGGERGRECRTDLANFARRVKPLATKADQPPPDFDSPCEPQE